MPSQTPGRLRKILVRVTALLVVLLICGALYDLYYPRITQMREFDPDAELLRTQYRMPEVRSNLVAYYAAHAAFVFKDGGKERSDYEKALPDLLKFYGAIRKMSDDLSRAGGSAPGTWTIASRSHDDSRYQGRERRRD
jgi:hypothetical protein